MLTSVREIYKSARFFPHYDSAKSYYVIATAIVIENRNKSLRKRKPDLKMNSETNKGNTYFVYKDNKFREYYCQKRPECVLLMYREDL